MARSRKWWPNFARLASVGALVFMSGCLVKPPLQITTIRPWTQGFEVEARYEFERRAKAFAALYPDMSSSVRIEPCDQANTNDWDGTNDVALHVAYPLDENTEWSTTLGSGRAEVFVTGRFQCKADFTSNYGLPPPDRSIDWDQACLVAINHRDYDLKVMAISQPGDLSPVAAYCIGPE